VLLRSDSEESPGYGAGCSPGLRRRHGSQNRHDNPLGPRFYQMSLLFEWDGNKAALNVAKHRVSFEEALTVFSDPLARIFLDQDHSLEEQREIIVGHSVPGHLLVVCFAAQGERVRILSARELTRRERQDYEENITP